FRSFFYTGVDRSNEKQQGFLLWMRRNGYRVIAKDLVQLPDGSKKANLDVEIAVDLVALVNYYDTAVVVSGDGDLAYAADAASYRGARIEVVSLRSMTSDSLINVADRYIDLEMVKDDIRKIPRGSQPAYGYRSIAELGSPASLSAEA
ncbi:MAG: NYN domain-containing protein, partial [Nodosilinea sp.]